MNKLIKKVFVALCWPVIGVVVGIVLLFLARDFLHPRAEYPFDSNAKLVFKTVAVFRDYQYTLEKMSRIQRDLSGSSYFEGHQFLQSQFANKKKRLTMEKKELRLLLNRLIAQYGDTLQEPVGKLAAWQKKNEEKFITEKDRLKQMELIFAYDKIQNNIYDILRQELGFYDVDNSRHASTMMLFPKMIEKLRKRPNDPTLCTVMKNFPNQTELAMQVVFIKEGYKYCDQYYNKPSSWGIMLKKISTQAKNKYDRIDYADYYKKYVMPKMPHAMRELKSKKNNRVCSQGAIMSRGAGRDPSRDALREAYKKIGKQYCPKKANKYFNTHYFCLEYNQYLFGFDTDTIEFCKPEPGVLFNYGTTTANRSGNSEE